MITTLKNTGWKTQSIKIYAQVINLNILIYKNLTISIWRGVKVERYHHMKLLMTTIKSYEIEEIYGDGVEHQYRK